MERNIGNDRHTVLKVRLRRSLHRDTLFAPGRKVSMGARFYRRARRRNTTADGDAEIAFEADIPSRGCQFDSSRVSRAGRACPAKQHKRPSRGSLAVVGLLQNRSVRRGPGSDRVRGSRERSAEREKRRRAADVVIGGAHDAARARPDSVE
jgi:hypothetical protein